MKKKAIPCEVCGKDSEMDITMPTPLGLFKADACMTCGLSIHEKPYVSIILNIFKKRAKMMKEKLPVSREVSEKICSTKTADIKVKE